MFHNFDKGTIRVRRITVEDHIKNIQECIDVTQDNYMDVMKENAVYLAFMKKDNKPNPDYVDFMYSQVKWADDAKDRDEENERTRAVQERVSNAQEYHLTNMYGGTLVMYRVGDKVSHFVTKENETDIQRVASFTALVDGGLDPLDSYHMMTM